MGEFLWQYTAEDQGQTTTILTFNPGRMRLVEPRYFPIQRVSIAESGQVWVFQLSSNVELEMTIDVMDIPSSRATHPVTTDGYVELYTFLANTVNWSQRAFLLIDPDGDSFTVRYISGFDTLREAGGRTERANFWSGTLTLRRTV